MKCPNCGTENQQLNTRFCIKCGAKIEPVQIMEQAAHMPPPAASRATDVPSGIGNDLQQEWMEGGIRFLGEGDNYTYVEKLKDHWYWYERHW